MTYRDDRSRIDDILRAMDDIARYHAEGRRTCEQSELIRIWLAYHVQVIGEAASKVSKDLKTKYAEVPWRAMAAMRHILVHDYFETDFEEVWIVVDRDLPELRRKIEELSKALD